MPEAEKYVREKFLGLARVGLILKFYVFRSEAGFTEVSARLIRSSVTSAAGDAGFQNAKVDGFEPLIDVTNIKRGP